MAIIEKTLRLSPGLPRSSTGSLRRTAPSRHLGTRTGITRSPASTSTSCPVSRCSPRSASSTVTPVGRASRSPSSQTTSFSAATSNYCYPGPRSAPPTAAATWDTCSMTGPAKPEACATASTPPPSASYRSTTWNAKATVPTASSSNRRTILAVHHDDRESNPRRRPPRRVKHHHRTDVNQPVHQEREVDLAGQLPVGLHWIVGTPAPHVAPASGNSVVRSHWFIGAVS